MLSPQQVRAARNWLDWTQQELARRSGVGLSTIRDFEANKTHPMNANLLAMQRAIEAAGITLIDDEGKPIGIAKLDPDRSIQVIKSAGVEPQ